MKTLSIILFSQVCFILICSCKKEVYETNSPNKPTSISKDSSIVIENKINLIGQKWLLYEYKIGEYGVQTKRSDTLYFINSKNYIFNKDTSTYNLYPALSTFSLTLNETFLGNISGTIYTYNLKNGKVDGLKFIDITIGASSSNYYLWLKKI